MDLRPTEGDENRREAPVPTSDRILREAPPSDLSSRPKRSRISYFAKLMRSTYAAFFKESRMRSTNAIELDRKSGGAQWGDLRFSRSPLGLA
jgi:hypothetical protein